MGLCGSLDDFSVSIFKIHHAPCILAEQLVRRGLLDASTAVQDDNLKDVKADQEHPSMDHVKSK